MENEKYYAVVDLQKGKEVTRMSMNINGNVEAGGLLSHEFLRIKNMNKNKPLTGQKLSGLKDAVTLQKKSEDGGSDAGAVKLLRRTEEQQISKGNMKSATLIQVRDNEIIMKEATRGEFYASLTKKAASDNATYKVDGVLFSAEEMTSIREALRDVFASVKNPGSNLVYSDYAKMGIAENVARSYAEKNLSEEQTEVIMKAVSEHMDQVIDGEAKAEIVNENLYYGKRYTGEEYERLHQMCLEAAKEAVANADFYSAEKKKRYAEYIDMCLNTNTHTGIVVSASNTKLTNSLRSGFANLDFGNEDELQTFFKQYQDWMEPAYLEIHGGSGKLAKEHLAEDLVFYKNHYKSLMGSVLAASVSHVDLQI